MKGRVFSDKGFILLKHDYACHPEHFNPEETTVSIVFRLSPSPSQPSRAPSLLANFTVTRMRLDFKCIFGKGVRRKGM